MPLREAPALSRLTGQPPFTFPRSSGALIVTAHSDGEQIASTAGWNEINLTRTLAASLVDAFQQHSPGIREMTRVQRSLRDVYPETADLIRELTIRERAEARATRHAERHAEST